MFVFSVIVLCRKRKRKSAVRTLQRNDSVHHSTIPIPSFTKIKDKNKEEKEHKNARAITEIFKHSL